MFKQVFAILMMAVLSISAFAQTPTTVTGTKALTPLTITDVTSVAGDTESGIAYVQWYLGSQKIGPQLTAPPYTYQWNTAGFVNGTYQITAEAVDKAGNNRTSNSQTVIIANAPPPDTTPPTIIIGAPSSGAVITGVRQLIQAAATDNNSKIRRMQIFIDGQAKRTVEANYIEFNWNSRPSKGRDVWITATALDSAGNSASTGVGVKVR